ncbi:RING-H2 finger protein ATL40-like [Impatiens glandulifera]|uniref:RING-H2 finger protein ATL40-like n=1 Tax=Impatiens glandulifera TaxID=253017 RepID=UPI001FB09613|nr:RING-H2 finger protein ATL40-like [Impatiens glandulifera]
MGIGDDDDRTPFFAGSTKEGFNMNSKIMISAISSLGFVVILVIALHIYSRFMIRRQSRRRTALLNIRVAALSLQADQQPKTGLDPAVIASLPIFAFKKPDAAAAETDDDCSVCLSLLETDEMVRKLPNCNHTFHAECIDMWLESHSTCPICRTEAQPTFVMIEQQPLTEPSNIIPSLLQEPTAPPIDGGVQLQPPAPTAKVGGGSESRMSSFRRIISRDRSLPRVQSCGQDDVDVLFDVERQIHQH